MKAHGVRNIVFSSSATVYGEPQSLPLRESHPVGSCTNPYGKSKYFIEEMIQDLCKAEPVRRQNGARVRWGSSALLCRAVFSDQISGPLLPGLECCSVAVLQPYWSPRVGKDRRGPPGHPKQPDALRCPGTQPLGRVGSASPVA